MSTEEDGGLIPLINTKHVLGRRDQAKKKQEDLATLVGIDAMLNRRVYAFVVCLIPWQYLSDVCFFLSLSFFLFFCELQIMTCFYLS